MTVRTYDELAEEIFAAQARLGTVRLVTVDGPSGSGKTTFARRLAAALCALGSLGRVALEDLYAGWTLEGAWERLDRYVLEPVAAGWAGGFHPYDWTTERWSPLWTAIPVSDVLVVEGCGSSPRAADPYTTARIWMDTPREVAVRRGLAREGRDLDQRLRAWRELEYAHFAAQATRQRANLRIDGGEALLSTYEPETSFLVVD